MSITTETDVIKPASSTEITATAPKSNRGRKRKYATDEERILARRAQQKAYCERKKKELLELRALKAELDAKNNVNE